MKKKFDYERRLSGVLLHPTSLPSQSGCGTLGGAARKWIELLASNGIGIWQFLPLSPPDSTGSPYSSPSGFAINPWLLDLEDLQNESFVNSEKFCNKIKDHSDHVSSSINFELANFYSFELGKLLRESWHAQSLKRKEEFENWSSKQVWLDDHACFMELRRQNDDLPWWQWPSEFSLRNLTALNNWKKQNKDKLLEHRLIQWHLDRQLKRLRQKAKENGVILFGDLPFYVSRDSADVWANTSLFSIHTNGKLLTQSGVPPDYFSVTGQLWGTPVYCWQKHQNTSFRWWRSRFERQWSQVDLLRLDHFRALSAYWSVPGDHKDASKGNWLPSPGLRLLSIIKKEYGSDLPLVAEDLGLITPEVEELRDYFKLPGMKILQFAYDGNLDNPYLPENISSERSIVYTGTHDNDTTKGWWSQLDDNTKNMILEKYEGNYNCPAWKLIEIGMNAKSFLFIAPLQDLLSLGTEARLNKPGTTQGNWSWRFNGFDKPLIEALGSYGMLTKSSGRQMNQIFNNSA